MKIIIEVPDNWWDDRCRLCPAKTDSCEWTINTCPLSNAREAVEVFEKPDGSISSATGSHNGLTEKIKLFAVEDKQ